MPITFDDTVRALLDGRNFAVLATVRPDGAPMSSTTWFLRDGDTLLLSSLAERVKVRNLRHEPRCALTVYDLANPYLSADVRGVAEILPDPEKELPVRLSQHYLGQDPPNADEPQERVVIRVVPERVVLFSPGG